MATPGKIIKKFLNDNGQKGTVTVPPEVMKDYLAACEKALTNLFTANWERKPDRLSVSDLGKTEEQMVEILTGKEVKEQFKYNMLLTFWRGNVFEAVLHSVLKMAAPAQFSMEQEKLKFEISGITIAGKTDFTFDDESPDSPIKIWDTKTANDRSYKDKWATCTSMAEADSYGYYPQGGAYRFGSGKPFGGWLLINPNDCRIKDLPVDYDGEMYLEKRFDAAVKRVENAAETVAYLRDQEEVKK